jgi:hypothetical protein
MLRFKAWIGCMPSSPPKFKYKEAYMKLFKDWATIFIENGISNPKVIMNSLNKPWSCSTGSVN